MKIAIIRTVKAFLLVDRLETSSKGPGCLYIEMNTTNNAIGQKPKRTK
jgi:hypothetical protein